MKEIKILSYMKLCLSDKEGKVLRGLIDEYFVKDERVTVNFEGVKVFASPFFNVSLGYFIGKYGIDKFDSIVSIQNLTPLGEKVYRAVKENAIKYFNSDNQHEIDEIVANTEK